MVKGVTIEHILSSALNIVPILAFCKRGTERIDCVRFETTYTRGKQSPRDTQPYVDNAAPFSAVLILIGESNLIIFTLNDFATVLEIK